MAKKPKRPGRDPGAITGDPHADVLTTILNDRLPHRQRASQARWCLKHGMHAVEALRVLREIITTPDKTILTRGRLDMARRTLIRYSTPTLAHERPMYLSREWGPLIGGIVTDEKGVMRLNGRLVEFTDDPALVKQSMDDLA